MQKDLYNDIEIPKSEIMHAIDKGIERGEKARIVSKKKSVLKRASFFTSIAAGMVLASGFVFTPVTNVLAQIPIIGSLYEKYQMPIGEKLASKQLITELNEVVEDNGVKMRITSIFYDGQYVGLTFKATGENLAESIGGERAPESGYTFEMFDRGDETSWWGGSMGPLTKEPNGYAGAMILENPDTNAADSFTLPITFTHMAGVKGEWSFNLPIEKLPAKEIALSQTISSSDRAYRIHFDKIVVGQTNATLSYEVLQALGVEGEKLEMSITDDKGLPISANALSSSKVIFEIDAANTDYVLIEPAYKIGERKIKLDAFKIHVK